MPRFCYITRSFSHRHNRVSFTLQLIWESVIFVSVVAGVFTLSFVLRIVQTKLNNYIIPLFLIWRLLSYEKIIVFENREWHCYCSTLKVSFSVFIAICIFLDAYVHKPSNKNLPNFSLSKKCTSTLNKNRQFVY